MLVTTLFMNFIFSQASIRAELLAWHTSHTPNIIIGLTNSQQRRAFQSVQSWFTAEAPSPRD